MIQLICVSMLVSSFIFVQLSHPVSLGLLLIFHTLLVGVATGSMSLNFWFSYVLFLVFLGGVLVLFIYMTSLASNEKFYSSSWMFMTFISAVVGVISVLAMMHVTNFTLELGGQKFPAGDLFEVTNWSSFLKLYSEGNYYVTATLIVYLLFVLLVCVSVAGTSHGALRNFN